MYKTYLELTKPGIVLGNLIAVTGGFLLGSRGQVDWRQGALTAAGTALVIASACAVNNVVDRDIDRLMRRTRRRAMANGALPVPAALCYAALLLATGSALLFAATRRWLPLMLALLGHAVYAGLYTLYLKRRSVHGTLVGSVSGAMPPLVGYCAARGGADVTALLLFAMFGLWQMPHSYAIAICRAADYRAAAIPVLPLVRGHATAKRHTIVYMLAFTAAALALGALGAGRIYTLSALLSCLCWLGLGFAGLAAPDDVRWARQAFLASIAVITVLCTAMALHGL